jgi:hypothetical protein
LSLPWRRWPQPRYGTDPWVWSISDLPVCHGVGVINFNVDARAADLRYRLAALRLELREQILTREQNRPADPVLTGELAELPLRVAQAAAEEAAAEVAAARQFSAPELHH